MDYDSSIIVDFESSPKSLRLSGYEQALQQAPTERLLESLKSQQEFEDDEECKVLLEHAIREVDNKLRGKTRPRIPVDNLEDLKTRFLSSTPLEKLELISGISTKDRGTFSIPALELLPKAGNPVVAGALIKTFGSKWPDDAVSDVARLVASPHLSIRIASMDLVISRDPKLLSPHLPELLSSEDTRIRGLALRALYMIDPEEAISHLETFFFSSDKETKLTGIQNSFFFPFEKTKQILFKFLAAETDPHLLEMVGALFASNPDPETPFHLYQIVEQANKEKAAIIKKILGEACKVIERTNLLGDNYPTYIDRLQHWIYKRSATQFVQECISRHPSEDEGEAEFEEVVKRSIEKPYLKEAFIEALEWPIGDDLKAKLSSILYGTPSPESRVEASPETTQSLQTARVAPSVADGFPKHPPEAPPGEGSAKSPQAGQDAGSALSVSGDGGALPSGWRNFNESGPPAPKSSPQPENANVPVPSVKPTESTEGKQVSPDAAKVSDLQFDQLPVPDQVRRLAGWPIEKKDEIRPLLKQLVETQGTPPNLLGVSLRTATRLQIPDCVKGARKILNHSDPNPASAALEYLGHFDSEQLFLYLGKFLQSPNIKIKTAAIKVLKQFDPPQAISMLKALLFNKDPEQQTLGMGCMVHFDFRLVRDVLTDFILFGPPPALQQMGLNLFRGNPEPDNLFLLFKIERALSGEMSRTAKGIREHSIQVLQDLGVMEKAPLEKIEATLQEKYKKTTTKKDAPPPPYSVKVMQERKPEAKKVPAPPPPDYSKYITPKNLGIAAGIFAGFIFLLIVFSIATREEDQGTDLFASTITVNGTVTNVASTTDEITVRTKNGKEYLIPVVNARLPAPESEVKVIIIPYHKDKNGVIQARLVSIEYK